MLEINKLPLAEEDLINIWVYGYKKWDVTQADSYIDSIEDKLNSLAKFPKKYTENKRFRPPVRMCPPQWHSL